MKEENNEIEEQITTKVLSPKAGADVWVLR